jgi:hypothetical protein
MMMMAETNWQINGRPHYTAAAELGLKAAKAFTEADDFGDGWGSGGDGGGGGGGFGAIPATMRKRCSKEDRLQRLAETGGTEQCEEAVLKALTMATTVESRIGGKRATGRALPLDRLREIIAARG